MGSGSMGSGSMGSGGTASTGTGSNGTPDNATSGTSAMDHSADSATSLKSVTGQVAKVDANQGSITLDQSAGGVTLTIDSQTKVLRRGRAASGISAIKEGEQVRASFDPASNRADKIEIMGRGHGMKHHNNADATGGTSTGGMSDSTLPSTSGSGMGKTSKDSAISPAAPSGNKTTSDLPSSGAPDTTVPDKK